MAAAGTAGRAEGIEILAGSHGDVLETLTEGEILFLQTSERRVRIARLLAVWKGAAFAAAGLALLWLSEWAVLLVIGGALYAIIAPRRINPEVLVRLDVQGERILASEPIPWASVKSIEGAFETKGWDGFSVIRAFLEDDSSPTILMLLGADERLAEAVCAQLGSNLGRPARYTGTGGVPVTCHEPAA